MSWRTSGSAFWHIIGIFSTLSFPGNCIESNALPYLIFPWAGVALTSLIVRDADVCCKKTLHNPTLYFRRSPSRCFVTCRAFHMLLTCNMLMSMPSDGQSILSHLTRDKMASPRLWLQADLTLLPS